MKNIFFAAVFSLTLFISKSNAQVPNVVPSVLKAPMPNLVMDGDLKDWGDSLQYFDAVNNIRYSFTNDKDNIYLALRIDDRSEAIRILKAGFTLGLDPKGKKKSAFSMTFPVSTQIGSLAKATQPDNFNDVTQADRDELHKEVITSLRGIKVDGFKDIDGDMITTSNSYGIKAALDYDEKGRMVCEVAISFKLLHADAKDKTGWLYDLKINGVQHAAPVDKDGDSNSPKVMGGGGGRGGMGGGGGRGGRGGGSRATTTPGGPDQGVLGKTAEFSGKFYLAAN